jgi:Zn-dependent metalloprotease
MAPLERTRLDRSGPLGLAALLVLCAATSGKAQDDAPVERTLRAMRTAAGTELSITRSPRTGLATFVAAPKGRSIPVPNVATATPRDRALSFVATYGNAFGLRDGQDVSVVRSERDTLGIDHVRLSQVRSGIPITGGELIVHLRGSRVLSANGKTLAGLDRVRLDPAVPAPEATTVARQFVERRFGVTDATFSEPRLEVFNQGILSRSRQAFPTRLAWFVEARAEELREFIWIDAASRMMLLHFSQLTEAKNRAIHDASEARGPLPGLLIRTEGQAATGPALLTDAQNAYNHAGHTYDYFFTQHGRDSFDNAGALIRATVRYCDPNTSTPCPYSNAFWNGQQLAFGSGYTADDDVVAHEFTHGVIERTANLFYYMQSGALNESYADIFGETVDQWNGDPEPPGSRWLVGEELPGGAIRSMWTPTNFGNPGKMSDPQFVCEEDTIAGDAGGVHSNSGVPNHAFQLMVDGGSYNGFTIAALDPSQGTSLLKAARIQYRALTQYLTSASDFLDNYNAVQQACSDLIGTAGITSANCVEVKKALDAVQMSATWACAPAQPASPALCPAGQQPVNVFFDNFEAGLSNWTIGGDLGTWHRTSASTNPLGGAAYATSGVDSLWGYDQATPALSTISRNASMIIPAGARLHFNHSYGFEDGGGLFYDGGLVEYSLNGGATWTSLNPLIMGGASYGGVIFTGAGNPLAGQSAFVGDSFGFTASQYNLASLAGRTQVRFRFRIGTDQIIDDYGWFIDDFRVYTCAAVATFSINDASVTEGNSGVTNATFTVTLSAPYASTVTVNYATADGTALAGSDYTAASGVLTFLAGETSKTITVAIQGETLGEANETFLVNLSGSSGPGISDSQGLGTIVNDDSTAVLSISPATVFEGDAGASTNAVFNVTMTGVPIGTVTVNYAATDVTANAGGDYTLTPGTLTFPLGQTTRTITAVVNDDSAVEPNETFTVTLSGISGGTLGTAAATGTIVNEDFTGPGTWTATSQSGAPSGRDRPSMVWTGTRALVWGGSDGAGGFPGDGIFDLALNSWAPLSSAGAPPLGRSGQTAVWTGLRMIVWGGNNGSSNLNSGSMFDPATNQWTATNPTGAPAARTNHTAVWTGTKMIVWGGFDGTANLNTGGVYDPAANTWTPVSTAGAPSGRSWHTAVWTGTRMLVWGGFDTLGSVTNSGASYNPSTNTWTPIALSGAPAARYVHTGVWTGDRMVVWGGFNPATLTPFATGGVYNPATDSWTTVASTNAPFARWFHTAVWTGSRMIVWGGRQAMASTTANLATGGLYDPVGDAWEAVPTTSAPTRRSLHSAVWTGTRMFSWGGFDGTRPTSGGLYEPPAPAAATDPATSVTSSDATLNGVVNPNGLATSAYFEYGLTAAYGTASTPAAMGSGSAPVPLTFTATGLVCAQTYHYRIVASNSLGTASGLDVPFTTAACPPGAASFSVADATVSEGYLSGSTMRFRVSLSAPLGAPISVNYATADGTALAGSDYTTTTGTLTFAAGEIVKFVNVPVLGDAVVEPNETFTLNLSSPSGAPIVDGTAIGTIFNDDGSTLSVTDYRIAEGTGAGATNLVFTVITSATSASPITVQYATANGTATAGSDYTTAAGTLTIPANVASVAVSVPVTRDSMIEPDETVLLNLSNAVGATIFDSQGLGTIVADDGLLVSISDKTTDEGNAGFTPINFTVTLSAPAPGTVTVDYATADGTATSPLDYTAANGTVTFANGESSKSVTVLVVGETGQEPYETFLVNLSNPTGATIGDGQGQGTITNTDGATDRSRLMFHNFVTNRLYRWHMKNGNTLDTFNWVTPWATDPGWTVGAVADFDQDGQLDYLWHNVNDGRMLFWYIDGDNLKGFQFLPYTMGPPWRVATTFDGDGNGTQDIVFYNSTTGVARVMQHDNATLLGQYDITTLLPGAGTLRVVAAGDANNDGDDELILFNSATGQIQAWNVSGATVASTINYPNTQVTSPAYNLVSTKTDFNNDGLKDLLWHNPTPTGVFSVWFMNGTARIGTGVFQPFTATDPVWKVVGSANLW